MKAMIIDNYGGPGNLQYKEVANPSINSNEVLVKVYATSINPVDWKVREGRMKEHERRSFPAILGWDLSGVVEQVGDEVKEFKKGDEVYGRPDTSRNGTYAEYIAVHENEIALKPQSVDHITAAAVPLAGLTAWQGIFDHGRLVEGQKILIHGAAGGVGTMAVQLAKWKGAFVIGTASGKNASFLKELGADVVIDYTSEDFSQKLKDIDIVFDTIGGDVQKKSLDVLKPGGILVSTVGIHDEAAVKSKGITGISYMAKSIPGQLRKMAELIDAGMLKPIISKKFRLTDVAEAQRISEDGHTRGKIAIVVNGS
jgi:NADPH:quinone reductase-like Zn-dependent oxidoreductase